MGLLTKQAQPLQSNRVVLGQDEQDLGIEVGDEPQTAHAGLGQAGQDHEVQLLGPGQQRRSLEFADRGGGPVLPGHVPVAPDVVEEAQEPIAQAVLDASGVLRIPDDLPSPLDQGRPCGKTALHEEPEHLAFLEREVASERSGQLDSEVLGSAQDVDRLQKVPSRQMDSRSGLGKAGLQGHADLVVNRRRPAQQGCQDEDLGHQECHQPACSGHPPHESGVARRDSSPAAARPMIRATSASPRVRTRPGQDPTGNPAREATMKTGKPPRAAPS